MQKYRNLDQFSALTELALMNNMQTKKYNNILSWSKISGITSQLYMLIYLIYWLGCFHILILNKEIVSLYVFFAHFYEY